MIHSESWTNWRWALTLYGLRHWVGRWGCWLILTETGLNGDCWRCSQSRVRGISSNIHGKGNQEYDYSWKTENIRMWKIIVELKRHVKWVVGFRALNNGRQGIMGLLRELDSRQRTLSKSTMSAYRRQQSWNIWLDDGHSPPLEFELYTMTFVDVQFPDQPFIPC